jgi:hypothetical protein
MASRPYHKSFLLTNASAELDTGLEPLECLQISNAYYVNTGSAVTVNCSSAFDGGAAATGNTVEIDKPLDAKATTGSALTGAVLNPGEKLYAHASTTDVVALHVNGIISAQNTRSF